MSSIMERPFGEDGAARPAGFHVAILLGSEIVRRGLTVMLNSLDMVKEVDIWDWESASRTSSITPAEAPDILILGFGDLDAEAVDKVAREAGRLGVKVLLLLNRLHEELFDLIAAIPSNGFLMQEELSSDSLATALTGVAGG